MARTSTHWSIRLRQKIRKRSPNECWEFTGKSRTCGYGVLQLGRGKGTMMAHRLTYIMHHGEIPPKMCVCHKCDNPICCNPRHLFLGSYHENLMDMSRKGRHRGSRKLTPTQVRRIKLLIKSGLSRARDLAPKFRIDPSTISKLLNGHSWTRQSHRRDPR